MVDINNRDDLEKYLLSIDDKDKQTELARVIAYRSALRVLPCIAIQAKSLYRDDLIAFRALAFASNYQYLSPQKILDADADAADAAADAAAADILSNPYSIRQQIWEEISYDCNQYEQGHDIITQPLWQTTDHMPKGIAHYWQNMQQLAQQQDDEGWSFWINFYHAALKGKSYCTDSVIALFDKWDDEDWQRTPTQINHDLIAAIQKDIPQHAIPDQRRNALLRADFINGQLSAIDNDIHKTDIFNKKLDALRDNYHDMMDNSTLANNNFKTYADKLTRHLSKTNDEIYYNPFGLQQLNRDIINELQSPSDELSDRQIKQLEGLNLNLTDCLNHHHEIEEDKKDNKPISDINDDDKAISQRTYNNVTNNFYGDIVNSNINIHLNQTNPAIQSNDVSNTEIQAADNAILNLLAMAGKIITDADKQQYTDADKQQYREAIIAILARTDWQPFIKLYQQAEPWLALFLQFLS